MYHPLQAIWVTPRGRKVLMNFRDDTNDWNTITSVMDESDEYDLRGLQVRGVAWDIGAHIGAVTVALLADNPELRVVAVEPVAENSNILWTNVWHNGYHNRAAIVRAAAGQPGIAETILHVNFRGDELAEHHAFVGTTEVGNSYAIEAWREGADHDRLTVPVVDFASLVEVGGAEPALIKIDAEGAEYAFLQAPETAQVPLILGEWHNVPFGGRERSEQQDLIDLLPNHDVTFSGPVGGPGGFLAVRRG